MGRDTYNPTISPSTGIVIDQAPEAGRPAPTEHPVHPLLASRWSPLAFDDRQVDEDVLLSLLEAARWAPSSFNEQPWRFVVGTKQRPRFLAQLHALLTDGNAWAKEAPVLILSAYDPTFSRNGKPNRVALRDLGAAEENLVLQAFDEGLVAHQMAGFDVDRARAMLPDGLEPGTMTAIGFPGDPASLPEKLRNRQEKVRKRHSLSRISSMGTWDGFEAPDDG